MTITKKNSHAVMFGDWPFGPRVCFAPEGEGGEHAPDPSSDPAPSEDPASDPVDPATSEPEPSATSWRDGITDPDLRKQAERFGSQDDVFRSMLDLRKKLSNAIVPPGKDASEDDIAAYRKRVGIPESPDKYDIPVPEGYEPTEADNEFRSAVSQTFHQLGLTADQAKGIGSWWNEVQAKNKEAEQQAHATYAQQQQEALRKEWAGDEYDKNIDIAARGAKVYAEKAGIDFEALRQIKTEDGQYLLDRADMVKMFNAIGRETGEDTIGVSEGDRETISEQITELRQKRNEAQQHGKHAEAKELDKKLMGLYAKRDGNGSVVGAGGRQY